MSKDPSANFAQRFLKTHILRMYSQISQETAKGCDASTYDGQFEIRFSGLLS